MEKKLITPVLFMIFYRPDTTQQVFNEIRKAKPAKLFIAADGPREKMPGETKKCREARDIIKQVDWNCEVKTLFRDKNLGCKIAASSAIDWFFNNVEEGIILEDDCLPSQSFFWFCEELLEKYKDNMRVWQIGGCNFQDGIKRGEASYYFSEINHIWGWASWANRWKFYDVELNNIPDDSFIKNYWTVKVFKYWSKIFWKMKNKEINSWDYQWTFTMWHNKGLAILPNVNLISNIGFGQESTHTKNANAKAANIPLNEIFDIIHPQTIERFREADDYTFKKYISAGSLLIRILRRIKGVIRWIVKSAITSMLLFG